MAWIGILGGTHLMWFSIRVFYFYSLTWSYFHKCPHVHSFNTFFLQIVIRSSVYFKCKSFLGDQSFSITFTKKKKSFSITNNTTENIEVKYKDYFKRRLRIKLQPQHKARHIFRFWKVICRITSFFFEQLWCSFNSNKKNVYI